ncbi:MAG: hypothetical protein U0X20_19045 [Caldilineaceae bacterium]
MTMVRRGFVVFGVLAALLAFVGSARAGRAGDGLPLALAAAVTPIPPGPVTSLPDYAGAPAQPQPLPSSGVPQNPLLAPNGFNSCHLDPWMSDTADIPGALGVAPVVHSSTFGAARQTPIDSTDGPPWVFVCITPMFDSHGRLLTACFAPDEATAVLADPDSLEVLSFYHLEVPAGNVYGTTGRQAVMRSTGSSYSYLEAQDRLTIVSGGKKIVTLVEAGSPVHPVLELEHTYDLSSLIPEAYNDVAGVMVDWQGRIWFITAANGTTVAKVGLINPATWSDAAPGAKWFALPQGEVIRNTFAVNKSGEARASAYVVSSQNMYRIDAGPDDQPYEVWSAPYDTIGTTKNGQYELGSGTSPTLLGSGDYVAITDNANPMKVVVYRTGEDVAPTRRVVCQVPVFQGQPGQALSNSLIGSGLSLIASNNYDYLWDWQHGKTVYPSAPGFARIDIDPAGQRCNTIWTSYDIATTTSPRLSTKTGLIYTVAREYDPDALNTDGSQGVYVYYWTAIDFRTGATVWKKMAGTGDEFDSFYPALAIGPDRGLYVGDYGGFTTLKDQPRVWCPIVTRH